MYRPNWKFSVIYTSTVALALVVLLSPPVASQASALAAKGPWLVYEVYLTGPSTPDEPNLNGTPIQLWAANSDGTGKTELAHDIIIVDFAVSPTGNHLAYITAEFPPINEGDATKLTLHWLTLPDGQDKVITRLTNTRTEPDSGRVFGVEAITQGPHPLQWSPDGQSLAFIGAQVGSSANVFVFSVATNAITQLSSVSSNDSSQAVSPSWSPDGKTIVYSGVTNFGSGAGWEMAGTWAAHADGSGTTLLYRPQPDTGDEWVVAWIGPSMFITSTQGPLCTWGNLRAFNLKTMQATIWYPGAFDDAAWSPSGQTLLFAIGDYSGIASCQVIKPGLYLSSPAVPSPHLISAKAPDVLGVSPSRKDFSYILQWSPGVGKFFIQGKHLITVTANGEPDGKKYDLTTIPNVSPDGQYWAWIDDNGVLNASPDADIKATQIAENVEMVDWLP